MNIEEQVIGACLLSQEAIRFAIDHVTPRDFYSNTLGSVFGVMVAMKAAGEPVDPMSVNVKLRERGIKGTEFGDLFRWMESVSSAETVDFYAKRVREGAIRRAVSAAGQSMMQQSGNEALPPAKVLNDAMNSLKAIGNDVPGQRMETKKLGEILSVVEDHDWVIEGLLERGDRMIITGYEGLGKTTWIRQMGICMSAGINPVTLDYIEPVRVMVVDVENTESQWRSEVRGMTSVAAKYGSVDPRDVMDVYCGGRIDITNGAALGELHRLVDVNQPDVLFIGPIYKLVPKGINNDEDASPVIAALDSIRDRGVCLIMEGHSPKGSAQTQTRDLSPRGSAALMGWPEFGFGLAPDGDEAVQVTRWRGDRDRKRNWPRKMFKGGPFPWTADEVSPAARRQFYGWNAA